MLISLRGLLQCFCNVYRYFKIKHTTLPVLIIMMQSRKLLADNLRLDS